MNDLLLPMDAMTLFYGDKVSGIKLKETTLLKQSYPIAFYTVVNILIDNKVSSDKKGHYYSSPRDMLAILNPPYLKGSDIRWEKVFTEEVGNQSLLKSECVSFIFYRKVYILYLYFDKKTVSSIKFDWVTYSVLLKSVIDNIKVNAKTLNVNAIVFETYNPNVKKILLEFGFESESETILNCVLPASRMLLNFSS